MSNFSLIIEERPRNIGNFMVGRLLPFQNKRMVGPFIFIDHMGPAEMKAGEFINIPPHPHIGLSTLTYLFEGNIIHKDSLGTEMEIKPGQVNWMTAGKGIVHSERAPENLQNKQKTMHGLQIWVALPKELEDMDPNFFHASEEDLPQWQNNGISYKLIAGSIMDKKSPVPVYSALYFLKLNNLTPQNVKIGDSLYGEAGIYILEGGIECDGSTFGPKELLVIKEIEQCEFTMNENTTLFFFGGDALPEERFIYWNFVSSDYNKIEVAKKLWKNQKFEKVPGDNDFIPLPDENDFLKPHIKM